MLKSLFEDKQATPPLKWAGGKRWLVSELNSIWQSHLYHHTKTAKITARLVEPFCGGLAIALGLNPKKAVLNDVNPHLINFYRCLQDKTLIKTKPPVLENKSAVYYQNRVLFNQLIADGKQNTPEAAWLFYYLNRTGYNGLCRFNQRGFYNVPFGQYKTIHYKTGDDWEHFVHWFQNWQFTSGDFSDLQLNVTDLIYADPPYDVNFVTYAKEGFTWADQIRLAQWLSKQPCSVVASNQATPRILELYQDLGFHVILLDAPRRIACNGDRQPAKEIIAKKI
ncbi:MAG: Dam family site-specific DNA-(adenine-N6)-methyltransferase [Cyanobacteria bacterium P01_H01_bin.74]